MIPTLTEIAKQLIIEREVLRSSSPFDSHIQKLNAESHHNIASTNRQKWTQTVESCSHKCTPLRPWSIIKLKWLNNPLMENVPKPPQSTHYLSLQIPPPQRRNNNCYCNSSPTLSPIPANRPPRLSDGSSIRSVHLIIRYPASILIFFRRQLKTTAVFLPLVQMASPFIPSKTWAP